MDLGSGRTLVVIVAVCLVVGAFGVLRESRHPTGHEVRGFRMLAGLTLVVTAVAGGSYIINQRPLKPIEVRGYGVVVEGVTASLDRRFDVGLALAQSVEIDSCSPSKPATVTLQIAPTAEFWIDNYVALADPTRVHVLIPHKNAELLDVSYGEYGVDPFTMPVDISVENGSSSGLTFTHSESEGDLVAVVTVSDWATERKPLRVSYTAPLVHRRGLGSCYVNLPALTGLPTVISGASLEGLDEPSVTKLEASARQGLFIVSGAASGEGTKRYAYYDPRFEITRGVTVLKFENALTEEDSRPTPDANFSGSPAWTCRSTVAYKLHLLKEGDAAGTKEAERIRDKPFFSTADSGQGTYSLSRSRIDEVLAQDDCAAQVEVEAASAGRQRDAWLLFVGALFSAGTGFLTTSIRRRRPAPTQGLDQGSGAVRGPSPATRRMLATLARVRQSRGSRPSATPDSPKPPTPE